MKYQVIFVQDNYSCVDFETDNYEQAQEVRMELYAQMSITGERNFNYVIKEVKN